MLPPPDVEPNYGHTVDVAPDETQALRDELMRLRGRLLNRHLAEIYAAFEDRPYWQASARCERVVRRMVGERDLGTLTEATMPTEADERRRIERILREEGVR